MGKVDVTGIYIYIIMGLCERRKLETKHDFKYIFFLN